MTLDDLRRKLDAVDADLIKLAAQRQDLVEQIGEVKRGHGKRTRDFAREKVVLEHAREVARGSGLSPGLAEKLLKLLIEHSLTRQEQERVAARAQGNGRRALVIGGAGRMGRWFAEFLTSQGYAVDIADPAGPVDGAGYLPDWREDELTHDVIVVAAPLRATNGILEELAEKKPPGLIFDIGSLKGPLRSGLQELADAGLKVTSVHPMFGPDAQMLSGRHVVFVGVGDADATRQARSLFDPTMAEQVEMSLDEHDQIMAYVLGLSHALNIVFSDALSRSGEEAASFARLSSTTFDAQLRLASQVASENPHLYYEIQACNAFGDEALERLAASAQRLKQLVESEDEEKFVDVMRRGRAYLNQ